MKNASLSIDDVTLNTSLTLHGVNDLHKDPRSTSTLQYQPVLVANHTYRLTWNSHVTPDNIDLAVYNLPRYDHETRSLCNL